MEKVKFVLSDPLAEEPKPGMRFYQNFGGDQSGEYVRAEVAEMMVDHLKRIVEWLNNAGVDGIKSALEIAQDAIKRIETENANDESDICGLCGQPGADKIPHPEHWPGERIPDSEFVHAECEDEECKRAHSCLTPKQRQSVLDSIAGR